MQSVGEALIYRVIYLFGPPRQITCDEAAKFYSHIVQAILERQIKTVSDIIVKHLRHRNRQFTKEEIFEDDQMVYLLAHIHQHSK